MSEYDAPATAGMIVGLAQHLVGYGRFEELIKSYSEQGYDNPKRAAVAEVFEVGNI